MITGEEIREFLISAFPVYNSLFMHSGVISRIEKKTTNIREAIVRLIIGQMLSRKAANSIYCRVLDKSIEKGLSGVWELEENELKSSGVSSQKSKAISLFRKQYDCNPTYFQQWLHLTPDKLIIEVNRQWGMSFWTANMLSIFYLGHEDVFPNTDESIKRAINLAHEQLGHKSPIVPEKARPYRSYLALYLWKALDSGFFNQTKV